MDNNENIREDGSSKNQEEPFKVNRREGASKGAVVFLVLLAGALGAAACSAAFYALAFPCLLLASASIGILATVFLSARSPLAIAAPLISAGGALVLGVGFFTSVQGACAIALVSALISFLAAKKSDVFRSRVAVTLIISLTAALAFGELLQFYFGSVGAGLDAITEFAGRSVEDTLNSVYGSSLSSSVSSAAEKMIQTAVMLLPGVIGAAGVISTWIAYGVIKALSVPLKCRDTFFPSATIAPRPVSALYIAIFFFSALSGFLPEAAYLTIINLYLILSVLFFGTGVKAVFTFVWLVNAKRPKILSFILSAVIIAVAFMMIPLFGAIVSFRSKKKVVKE